MSEPITWNKFKAIVDARLQESGDTGEIELECINYFRVGREFVETYIDPKEPKLQIWNI